ncbi:SDR family oxidoreductase [Agriterribacter sp.]|uniref:SDR family NAD(P)-dependent oxidoreductase n=1 Tax=Agriterribacter sp. TaxID=2821509 RepID=UPI002B98126C|nr:SDR family oxidoreductase [Agriterribacter sp.]HTN07301.1 SDR family oxidoreductase [Agriterribacter sp.]
MHASSGIFNEQVAIVTGAGQGIGFEIARQLCVQGASVVLNDVDEKLASQAAATIVKEGHTCMALPGDVSSPGFITAMVKETVTRFGKLTVAIANAGITLFGDFLDYPPDSLYKVMQLNLGGSFLLAQATAKQIIQQGSGGSILFMSSVTGHQAHKKLAAYGMTKAALEMLAKTLVVELSEHKISVNAIAPGATVTERTGDDPEYVSTWSRITPMGRPAQVQDIANAALFLVSPASRHITGQSLVVDGGWTSVSPSPY